MFEENENLVEESTENVEQTTEEMAEEQTTVTEVEDSSDEATETFTKEQVDEMIAKKLARKENKLRKEYESKYSRLETVVNAGLGTSTVEESTKKLEEFYKKRGVPIPQEPTYSERQTELLANQEADDIIDAGFDEVVEEVERLANIGLENMTPGDKLIFTKLAKYRQGVEQEKELRSIGIGKEAIEEEGFKEFAKKLNPDLSLKEKYEMYSQMKPKKQVKPIGSVKSGVTSQVKDFYSPEEIERLTEEELDDPAVWEAVRKSMTGRA